MSYTVEGGTTVTESVTLPWESRPVSVRAGGSYRVEVTAPLSAGSHFYCGVHTDTRWNAGETEPGDQCVYVYPDDVGE